MTTTYRPKQAADLANVSTTTLYNYGRELAEYLSNGANPPKGTARSYTPQDVKTLAFAAEMLRVGTATYEDVRAALASGELEDWEYSPVGEGEATTTAAEGEASAQLVPASMVAAYRAMLEDSQRREETAQEKLDAAELEIRMLQRELGTAQGQVLELRKISRPWWQRWFWND